MNRLIDFSSRFRILKGGEISLVVSALLGSAVIATAAPTGGTVTSGDATISSSGNVTNINQSSNKATINWNNFSISSNETVNFDQSSSSSVTLNRVIGNEKSIIDGALNSNGQVWILNSNGILFGKNASVNTAGLLATTAELSDNDFNAGNYNFKNNSSASVINLGTIKVNNSSYVVLVGKEVQNDGNIEAILGKVHLVGANEYSINLNGNSLVNLKINKGVLDALVKNAGTIIADGGEIFLTTNAVDELLKGVVNNEGIIEANSLDGIIGKVELFAHGGTAQVSGTIEVIDGFVETSGEYINISDNFRVKANSWLIDPVDFKIAASGGNITGTALSANLANANVTILSTNGTSGTNGDIFVNDAISWSSDYDLTLNAQRNIYINKNITATGTGGKLSLLYGQALAGGGANDNYTIANGAAINLQSGQNFSTKKGSSGTVEDYTVINGADNSAIATALQNMNSNLSGKFALGANVDLNGVTWTPIGALFSTKFAGMFDGLGHTIDNLAIDASYATTGSVIYGTGFFGYLDTISVVRNVGLTNVDVKGGPQSGALAGVLYGKVYNVYSTGNVTGLRQVGGLIGNVQGGATLSNSYSTADVNLYTVPSEDNNYLGGLVGYHAGTISNSYAMGNVNSNNITGTQIGGFSGSNNNSGIISNSYFAGTITNGSGVFVGNNQATINNSYWDTDTTGITADDGYSGTTGITTAQFADTNNFSTWDSDIWKFSDATVAGYGIASRPFLAITTDADKPTMTALFAGGYGTSVNPYTITTTTQLQNMGNDYVVGQNYYYNLSNNIDLAGVTWTSIGRNESDYTFKGTFDGQNHTIDNLTMSINSSNKGFFGVIDTVGEVKNIGLTNSSITISNANSVGVLAGANLGTISNAYTTGSINSTGSNYIGGLAGFNNGGIITDSYSTVNVTNTSSETGGLVGENRGTITNSYATGNVSGTLSIGGLVGENRSNISKSYATGQVNGDQLVGGFVGYMYTSGNIDYSYSTGSVTGTGSSIGGFIGGLDDGSISNSYSTGSVSGGNYVGGFTGYNYSSTPISNSYATGAIQAITTSSVGGFTGWSSGGITNSFWDTQTTGIATDKATSGTTGKTTAQMKTLSTFSDASWVIEEDSSLSSATYPIFVTNIDGSHIWRIKTIANSSSGEGIGETTGRDTGGTTNIPTQISNNEEINKVITSIVNTNAIKFVQPKVNLPIIPFNRPINMFNGNRVNLVSAPIENQPTTIVNMNDLKVSNENKDIKVAVGGNNSLLQIVNSGTKLPGGVDQLFFVVDGTINNQDVTE